MGHRQCGARQSMEVGMTEVDEVIEHYKSQLLGEAELARGDLKEIEDHLRTLTEELRERGVPELDAVRAACERLGDPRAVAREHARVHSPFGARLSRARSISAALFMLPLVIRHFELVSGLLVIVPILGAVMIVALLARVTWARPIVLGGVGFFAIGAIQMQWFLRGEHALWLIPHVGTVLFVMPWRRNELYRAGFALALQALAFGAAVRVGGMMDSLGDGPIHMAPAGLIAFFALVIAVSGTVLRARWAALASVVGAVMLVASVIECAPFFLRYRFEFVLEEGVPIAVMLVAAAIAATIAAFASWKSARTTIGTLHYVLR
jgi:hypothetical protein